MTVYFVRRANDHSQIKIGHSSNYESRIKQLTSAFGDLELFALVNGGPETEQIYHKAFAHLNVEGEWFRAERSLLDFIEATATPSSRIYAAHKARWKENAADSPSAMDAVKAADILEFCMKCFASGKTVAQAHELVFSELNRVNGVWTRRRVRSIYEGTARRIDAFEMVDLLTVAGIARHQWAEWISPKQKELAA